MAKAAQLKPLVVKIGGSLIERGRLADVARLLAMASRRVVIVTGGGPFADAVREAQRTMGFSDRTAHRMALLAMHQTALMLAALGPRMEPADSLARIRQALKANRVPIWLPYRLADADRAIPTDWSITSDGLAARLAERLCLDELVVVKSCTIDPLWSIERLAAEGIVDPALPVIAARADLAVRVLGQDDDGELADRLGIRSARRTRVASAGGERHERREERACRWRKIGS